MPGTVLKDQITTLEIQEQNGVIWTLRREVLVHSITDPVTSLPYSDFRVLKEALNACDAVGLAPQSVPEQGALFDDLRLVERIPSLVSSEKTKVRVELIYEQLGSTLDSLGLGIYLFSGSATLGQTTTQKDRFGNNIFTSYDYPANYKWDENVAGTRQLQGGSVQVDAPNDVLSFTGREQMVNSGPTAVAQAWRGHVNATNWRGGAPGEWLCTSVPYDVYHVSPPNLGPPIWTFTWTFAYDSAGWDPGVVYIDPRTGKRPDNLIAGQGFYIVPWYPPLEFKNPAGDAGGFPE